MAKHTFEDFAAIAAQVELRGRVPRPIEQQENIRALKLWAWHSLNTMVEQGIELLDLLRGDPDFENCTNAEDEGISASYLGRESRMDPGCEASDGGEECADQEGIDEREPEDAQ